MRLKGGLNWTPFCTSKTNIMVISESSLYGLNLGSKLTTALGNSKSSDAILKHADDEDWLESRIAISGHKRKVNFINEGGLSGLTLSSKWATTLGYSIDSMNFVRPCG